MSLFGVLTRLPMLLLLALCLSGCFPPYEGPAEEEKDPHYLEGMKRKSSLDYDGAIAAFENALVSNPKSAAAHLELGFLFEEHKSDYGAAVYHFSRHLELKPESNVAEPVKQHIVACKLELAKTVPFALVNRQVQDELRKLHATNTFLLELVEQLKAQLVTDATTYSNNLAQLSQSFAQERAQARAQAAAEAERRQSSPTSDRRSSAPEKPTTLAPTSTASSSRPVPMPRTHTVRSGETFASIAKRYNIKTSSLQAMNPSIDARRLKAGQILNLPNAR